MIIDRKANVVYTDTQSFDLGTIDVNRTIVTTGALDIFALAPDGTEYLVEKIVAPVAPLTAVVKQIQTRGLSLKLTPVGGGSYWISA